MWDGDQVLYEISAPGGSSATAAQMEADTGLAVPFFLNQQHTAVAGFFPYGRVMYEHGGGIDAPLGVVRMEYSSELHDPQVIVPHSDWRGTYDRGTTIVGSCVVYSSNGTQLAPPPDSTPTNPDQYGGVAGGGGYGGTKEHCIDVDWPAAYTWSARQYRRGYSGPDAWMGSLIFESRDASGLYYRRNRYYDSEKGRFTQEDPIGLAGGVNVYGFAGGDPISRGDPLGLCPDSLRTNGRCPGGLSNAEWNAVESAANQMVPSEREQVLQKLRSGGFNSATLHPDELARTNPGSRAIVLNTSYKNGNVFTLSSRQLALLIGHEMEHVRFFNRYGQVYGVMILGFDYLGGYRDSFLERVADQAACRALTNRRPGEGHLYGC